MEKSNKKMMVLSAIGIILVVLGHTGYPISLARRDISLLFFSHGIIYLHFRLFLQV